MTIPAQKNVLFYTAVFALCTHLLLPCQKKKKKLKIKLNFVWPAGIWRIDAFISCLYR